MGSRVENLISQAGFDRWGLARLERPHTFDYYREWINRGHCGEMDYLRLHLPKKEDPSLVLPKAQSAIVVAVNYRPHPHPHPLPVSPLKQLKVASYAQGLDYHHWLCERLEKLIERLRVEFPDAVFMAMTDSQPVMERDLGHRAGLGWFGKNSCLIHQETGSFFLIGEIYTSLNWDVSPLPPPDLCGTCSRCIDLCPTQALLSPRELDARRCISYWTIESREVPPEELRPAIGEWFFGCDICQQVCPWNEKAFGRELMRAERETGPDLGALETEVRYVLSTSNKQLLRDFAGTPLVRAGGRGLKRNAILVAVRHQLRNLKPEIVAAAQAYPQLEPLTHWALAELEKPDVLTRS